MKILRTLTFASKWILLFFTAVAFAEAQADNEESDNEDNTSQPRSSITPDVRGSEMKVKVEKGNFVIVPIPISNPTLDTGLVVGAAYFYRQTEEQKKVQPASVTGAAAMYTSNKSYAFGIGHESYWDEDKWRFIGATGYADMNFDLATPDGNGGAIDTEWLLSGDFPFAQIARKIAGRWYLGILGRFVDMNQDFVVGLQSFDFDLGSETKSVGLGVLVERDSRDMPTNAYSGNLFKLNGLFNDQSLGSDKTYESYNMEFNSYHKLSSSVVLAWQVVGCLKSGTVPLWDTCRVGLRGFPATKYLGKSSAIAQIEARWQVSKKWGLVGFAGAGYINNSFSEVRDREAIPSYGLGLRFMVMTAKRINVRLDYGRSNDSDAVYLSVGEAF
jgi:hypothetical protein